MDPTFVPAAQYLRMSTDHQQYSLDNQSDAIARYATEHRFHVIKTYSDPAKSGLRLKNRAGLKQLLKDAVGEKPQFRAILVYDISRWGRFQDHDEAAHYEYICKSAGVPVHYCAEMFGNENTAFSWLLKSLKRTMAGEYSRELGVKVLAGQKRLVRLGFKPGGLPGYGLRRMLVSEDRRPKQLLAHGERKGLATDRVILVPGPAQEIQIVREIYRMYVSELLSMAEIVEYLNREGITYPGKSGWSVRAISNILSNPKYVGCNVFGRTSSKLSTPIIRLPKSDWLMVPEAFEPIVTPEVFHDAQTRIRSLTINQSDEELLSAIKTLWTSDRRLSWDVIAKSTLTASPSTYRERFGSLTRVYDLIGYGSLGEFSFVNTRRRSHILRDHLLSEIVSKSDGQILLLNNGARHRSLLKLNGLPISLLISRMVLRGKHPTWQVQPVPCESRYITLLTRLTEDNSSFMDFYVFPRIERTKRFTLTANSPWLEQGMRLTNLSELCQTIGSILTPG